MNSVPRASPNRIQADLSKQAPNNSYSPRLYYEDFTFKCRKCHNKETWTAEQQQWWYEVAKGPVQSVAVLCHACREAGKNAHRGAPRKSHRHRKTNK